ncbi:MAG TPA: tetratricopeptide repeat protein [Edaphobacter sp.]|nr:tetratricopeptide repeat protein [Edaphobacter sp.]
MVFPPPSRLGRSLIVLSIGFVLITRSASADNAAAESALKQGRVDEATSMLKETLKQQPHDAYAHQLLCRVYYAQDKADSAVTECERSVGDDPSRSDSEVWLGRAYGLKASQINMLSAFVVAKKVAAAFERAVELDSSSVQAMSDLGQFYVAAPAIVGGGLDKAQALAPRLMAISPAKGHRLLAMIAQKKGDAASAEKDFKDEVAAGKTPDAWVDLAQFYQQQSQADKAVAALEASVQANHSRNNSLVDVASILTDLHRRPDLAEKALREYLESPAKTDDAPAFKVHLQLGDILKKRGDVAGAKREYAAAVGLASHFAPAQKAANGE